MAAIATLISGTDSSNRGSIRLLEKNSPANLKSVKKMVIKLDDGIIIDSKEYPIIFDWRSGPKGVVRLFLGRLDFGYGSQVYNAKLFVYDDVNALGIYWGDFRIRKVKNGTTPL